MDINEFLSNTGGMLTSAELRRRAEAHGLAPRDGRYVGTIATVAKGRVYNRFNARHEPQPIITFTDNEQTIPNKGMARTLAALFGDETDAWVGRCICIFLRPGKRIDKATGKPELERAVMLAKATAASDDEAALVDRRFSASDAEPADYDDSPAAQAWRKGRKA